MFTQNIKNYIKSLLKKDTVDTITKKDIFIGILTSPMILLVIATFIYLATACSKENTSDLSGQTEKANPRS